MNLHRILGADSDCGRRWRKRCRLARHTGLATAGILAVGIAVSACGGPSTPGVATGSSTTTTSTSATSASSGGGTRTSGVLAFAACVRAHGVTNFPDPNNAGVFPKGAIRGATVAQIRAAEGVCFHLVPAGSPLRGVTTAQEQADYLDAAACMRSHGITAFPDPVFSNGNVNFPVPSSMDTHATRFVQAQQICEQLIPAGFPYSGRSG